MHRPNREIVAFSLSAVDLFASALGAFMIVVVLLLPYFRNLTDVEARRQEARQHLEEVKLALAEANTALAKAAAAARAAEAVAEAAESKRDLARQKHDAAGQAAGGSAKAMAACATTRASLAIGALDVVLAVDTTGSMGGELSALRTEIGGIARVLDRIAGEVRIGVVAYRDDDGMTAGSYVTRTLPLVPVGGGLAAIEGFLGGLDAAGGGNCPEDVHKALTEAAGLSWRPDARRHIVVVGDAEAAPSDQPEAFTRARDFAATGGKVSAVFTSHPDSSCSMDQAGPFFRKLATEGQGRFVDGDGTVMEAVLMALLGK